MTQFESKMENAQNKPKEEFGSQNQEYHSIELGSKSSQSKEEVFIHETEKEKELYRRVEAGLHNTPEEMIDLLRNGVTKTS